MNNNNNIYIQVLEFYNFKKNLYFVDVGANNGKYNSNTHVLEKDYDWDGICVESLPYYFNSLKNRRNSKCENITVFDKSDKDLYFSKFNYYLNKDCDEYINYHEENNSKDSIKLKTITLKDLFKKHKTPTQINYLTLNAKGKEICILNSVDLRNYKILYLSVEHNYTEPRRTKIKNLLETYGFLYINNMNWYDNYIHEDVLNGIYYINNDKEYHLEIKRLDKYHFYLASSLWDFEYDTCTINSNEIHWEKLDLKGKIYYDYIDYGNGLIWYKN